MKRLRQTLKYNILNLLGILAALVGMMALDGVSILVSDSLYRLPLAGVFFFAGWQLLSAGLSRPIARRSVSRPAAHTPKLPDGSPTVRRAA